MPCDILNEPFTPSVLNTLGLRLLHFERPDVDVILTVSGHSCPHLRSAFYAYTSNDLVAPRHAASYGWPSDPAPITPNLHTP